MVRKGKVDKKLLPLVNVNLGEREDKERLH